MHTTEAMMMFAWYAVMTTTMLFFEVGAGLYQAIRYSWWPDTKARWAAWHADYLA